MLLLVPAGVLVLFVLGAIAVDAAVAFLAQRELTGAAAAAANDAATAAVSDEAFYRGDGGGGPGDIDIDDGAATRVARLALEARAPRGIRDLRLATVRAPGRQVCVVVTGEVDHVFARAIPGVRHSTTVSGRAVATAVDGDGGDVRRGDPDDVC